MIRSLRSSRRPTWPFIAITVILLFLFREHISFPCVPRNIFRRSVNSHIQSRQFRDFWKTLHGELVYQKPAIDKIKPKGGPSDDELDPNKDIVDRQRPNLLDLGTGDVEVMRICHDNFVKALDRLGPQLPYWKGSRGIVMTAGGKYVGTAMTSILMIRRSGSKLPVHLFLDTRDDYDSEICDVVLPRMNVECVIMEDALNGTSIEHYQYKVFSVLFSPFQHVLFLDADAWPIYNPDFLFGVEPYISHGLVTWPDFWLPTVSSGYYDIARWSPPHITQRRSSESSILLYNKAMHTESLLLSAYYNWYGPGVYYPLLSQGAIGEGDKETFIHGAMVLDRPFYDVHTAVTVIGRWLNGTFLSAGMKQADPSEDFRLYRDTHDSQHGKPPEGEGARSLFIHSNMWKMDLYKLGQRDSPMYQTNETGHVARIWGPDTRLVERSGYDVERAMWDEIIKANCRATFLEECRGIREYYRSVFIDNNVM